MIGIIVWYIAILSQFNYVSLQNSCENQMTCQECLADTSLCAWCAANDFVGTRCTLADSIPDKWCPEQIINPKGLATVPELDNRDFSSNINDYVQIKPQSYHIELRPGEPVKFNFSFQGSKNYPVDLYFLMDASTTMKHYKQQTADQSVQIYKTFKNMTDNVYLGLGTFIDKNVLPFSRLIDSNNTYSFKHRLTLNGDIGTFRDAVSNSTQGINRDAPEGGFDALAQVLACDKVVGWREGSRKIVVFLTDAPSHVAGDGKAAGIFDPYDGKCYSLNNTYDMEKKLDYPSLGMINKLASENEVIILFAVTNEMYDIYSHLNKAISGSKTASIQQSSGDSIVTILRKIYKDITNKIKLKVNIKAGFRKSFDVSISPDCINSDNGCDSRPGKEQMFEGTIKIVDEIAVANTTIDIMIEGITEKLVLNISVIKECECQKIKEINSKYCNNGGTRQCGICQCDSTRYGPTCACKKDKNNATNDNSTCIAPASGEKCSGHGDCICGICHCNEGFECNYCQYHTKSCGSNGRSECGKCKCNAGYTGENCECNRNDERCIDKETKIKCNHRGQCGCGKCECQAIAKWDKRTKQDTYCRVSPCSDCNEEQCRVLEPCVLCKLEKNDCPTVCDAAIDVQLIDTLSNEHSAYTSWTRCNNVRVSVGCSTPFLYKYDDKRYGISVMVVKNINCAENYYWIGGVLLVTLLLGGIGVLVGWKLLTTRRDRREYQEFMSKNLAEISEITKNPLFKPPCVEVNNPGFRKRSVR